MTASASTCIKALRALAWDIQSEDGVVNAALHECADRMERLEREIDAANERIKRLEDVGDKMEIYCDTILARDWKEAKEAKP